MPTDNTPDLYVSRPQQVEAIQWDGTTNGTVVAGNWAPGSVRWTPGDDAPWCLELLAGKDGAQDWVPVPVGHWLVRQPGDLSDIWPVAPDYFAAKYQPAVVAERADSPQPDTAPEGPWTVHPGRPNMVCLVPDPEDAHTAEVVCRGDVDPGWVAAALNGAPAFRRALDASPTEGNPE